MEQLIAAVLAGVGGVAYLTVWARNWRRSR